MSLTQLGTQLATKLSRYELNKPTSLLASDACMLLSLKRSTRIWHGNFISPTKSRKNCRVKTGFLIRKCPCQNLAGCICFQCVRAMAQNKTTTGCLTFSHASVWTEWRLADHGQGPFRHAFRRTQLLQTSTALRAFHSNPYILGPIHSCCLFQARVPFPEVLAVYYAIRMLRCVELLHGAHVLHGDIKPDNWLMTPGNPSLELPMNRQELHNNKDTQAGDLYLIDYGRSIDLALYPDGAVFRGNCHAKGFQSVEMLTQRPWTYQIDTFALCGTIHCMLFGEYMEVKLRRNAKCTTHWGIAKPFKRYWQVDMWKDIFHALLNVRSCSDQPSLTELRKRLENYLVSDAGRQQVCSFVTLGVFLVLTRDLRPQELFKQLRRQEVFLRKSTV